MYQRILVPVGFTQENRDALERAGKLVSDGGEIIVLHVIETIPHLDESEDREFYDRLRNVAEHKIVRLTSAGRKDGVRYRDEIVIGKRALEILRFAEQEDVDLVVMNSRRPDMRTAQTTLGTTSHVVAVWAACPVFLIKQ